MMSMMQLCGEEVNAVLTSVRLNEGSPQEADEEGHPVLPDGLRCFWNWYARTLSIHQLPLLFQHAETNSLFSPIGRTTFVNTLCGKKVLQSKDADDAENAHIEEGVRIKPVTVGTSINPLDPPPPCGPCFLRVPSCRA
jgi:hypothetical protein